MTDLHCHILPNIDDGAKDVSISLRLLEKEYADGVRNIAFTSHFNSEWTTPDAFLQKRAAAYETLTAALPTGPEAMQFRFKLGCEVYFSPKLCELDAKALCIGDTSYMLVEFPTTHKPHFTWPDLRPPAGAGCSAPHRPHRAIPLRPRRPHPALQLGGHRSLCPNQRGRTAGFSKTAPDALQVHLVAACPRHLDGHPLPGQTPAPDGRSCCCSGKGAGQRDCLKAFAERRRTFRR